VALFDLIVSFLLARGWKGNGGGKTIRYLEWHGTNIKVWLENDVVKITRTD